ncbi:MAG: S9 family peptidase [Chloroflexi bacterium]|nr:S9 family peptidase [Chloroflexota bacterium]
MLDLTQLLRVPRVDAGFDISPDETRLAFAWNKTGEWQIYELELELPSPFGRGVRGEGEITQLTSSAGGKFNPRYSPDGTRLAYALDFDGSESYHLFVYDRATGRHTDLTPNIAHALQPNFCWSPDSSQIAFLSDQHGHFSAYVISSYGGDPQLVLDTGHPAWQVEWSPDGKHLAVCCEMHGQDYGVFIVELETKEVTPLCYPERQRRVSTIDEEILRSAQNDMLNAHDPKWSPDGTRLAFHADPRGRFEIGIYDLASREISWVAKNEGDSQSPVFAPNSDAEDFLIAYAQNKGVFNWTETVNERGERKKYQAGKGIHRGIKFALSKVEGFTPDSKRMVTTFSSPSQPPDLWLIDMESGESIQLTHSMPEELAREEFVMPEEIEYPGMDGAPVPALLFRPAKMPSPTVVMIHGGPNWHYSMEWNPMMAHFASRGYAVLAPNYCGSTGYGRAWQYAARFDLGGADTRDVAAGAQWLIREGIADPKRIAVTGRSHGGYLTMTCLTQFPELWCGGSAVVPFMNWFKTHENSREDVQHWDIENMGNPKENYERWYNASPYFFLDKINAPVQLICGGNDPRCPAVDSMEARDKLVTLGKDVELLLYEDESHAFLKIENVIASETKRAEFLAKALEKDK